MRAIQFHESGGPDVLRVEDVDSPAPASGQLLVEVEAAGVNFIDVYFRTGLYPTELPSRPGKEGAGRVVEVGPQTEGWRVGDRVAWPFGAGAYAEIALVEAAAAVRIPEDVDANTACALMLQGLTAHYLAQSVAAYEEGDFVLAHAGAGGVGLLLTQLLARAGAQVITTASTGEKAALSLEAGAIESLPYDDFDQRVRELTGDRGVAAVFDGVGASVFDRGLDLVHPRGTYVAYGNAGGPIPPIDPLRLKDAGSLNFTRPSLEHFIADRREFDERAADLFRAHADGWLTVRVGQTYELADAAQAHRDLEARRTTGKLLLLP